MSKTEIVLLSEKMNEGGGRIEGASPLSGRLGLPTLLVREAVQNSWDARDDQRGDKSVDFRIDGWDLDGDELEHLRSLIPVANLDIAGFRRDSKDEESHGVLHPKVVLKRNSLRVLVISDRNTVGLCGPSRSGRDWQPVRHGKSLDRGQQRFANFVRNMGRSASNIGGGDGGAYGVGKSALWMASECGTILIHSRTTDEKGKSIERFIGSIHGEYFVDRKGFEHTGRHYIGQVKDEGIIDPLTGADAQRAARQLPIPSYTDSDGNQVDGTSIIIVAPRLFLPWAVEMDRLRDAVRWHVWPKRVPNVRSEEQAADIDVRLSWNNNPVDVPTPLDDPEIRPYAKTLLDCARQRNSSEESRDVVANCYRPIKILGEIKFRTGGEKDSNVFHLTRTREYLALAVPDNLDGEIDDEPAVDFTEPWGKIALIRREPLLLVRYKPIGGREEAETEVGVFLSADDQDIEAALTKAEPPAHDDWNPQQLRKEFEGNHRKTFVKRILAEIERARSDLVKGLSPSGGGNNGGGEQEVSRRISAGLFGGIGGKLQPPKPTPPGGGGGSKPRAQLSLHRSGQNADGTTSHEVTVTIVGIGATAKQIILSAGGSAHDNSGSMDAGDLVSFSWESTDGDIIDGRTLSIEAVEKTNATLLVTVTGDLRIRPKVDVEVLAKLDAKVQLS
jgi:hypothetical protein